MKQNRAVPRAVPSETKLRRRAETHLQKPSASLNDVSPEHVQNLIHELQVHQIELEMQNEELRRAQNELEITREKYFDLYDRAPVGYLMVDASGLILEANLTAAKVFGVNPNQLVKRPLTQFIARDDQDIFYHYNRKLTRTNELKTCELRMVRPDNSLFWVELETSTTRNAQGTPSRRVVLSDITKRKQAEEEIRRLNAELEQRVSERTAQLQEAQVQQSAVFDTVTDGISVLDAQGNFLAVNNAFANLYGYTSKDDLIGKPAIETVTERDRTRAFEYLKHALLAGPSGNLEYTMTRRDGSEFFGEVNIAPIMDESNRPIRFVGVTRDITQRKATEQTLGRYADEHAALYQTSLNLNAHLDMSVLLNVMVEQAVALMGVQAGAIYLYDADTDVLCCAAGIGFAAAFVGSTIQPAQGLTGRVFLQRKSARVDDYQTWEGRLNQFNQTIQFHALLAAPILGQADAFGVLNIYNAIPQKVFRDHDVELAELFAAQAALAIQNAQLFDSEREQHEIADTLREIGNALTATLNTDSILDYILKQARRLVPHDAMNIMLVEDEMARVVQASGYAQFGMEAVGIKFDIHETSAFRKVFTTHQAHVIADSLTDPAWLHIPKTEWIRAYACAPIIVRNEVIGFLNVDSATPGFFKPKHAERLQLLASQTAIALENARLYEKARATANHLQSLAHHLVQAQENERARIARELHDEIGQALTAQIVDLHFLEQNSADPTVVTQRAADLKNATNHILEELHRLTIDLRPVVLDHLGLVAALRQYVNAFQQQHAECDVQFQVVGEGWDRLASPQATAFYRIVQQSLTNVAQHAQAHHVEVLLSRHTQRRVLIVWDDGVGFDPEAALRSNRLGLTSMKERATMLGGTLWIESQIGKGTTIHLEVPNDDPNFAD